MKMIIFRSVSDENDYFSFCFFQTENLLMDADKNIKIAGKYCQ